MPAYENLFPAYLYIYRIKTNKTSYFGITSDFNGLPEYFNTVDKSFDAYELLKETYSLEKIAEGEYNSYDEVQYFYNWHIRNNKCININYKYSNTYKLNKLFENQSDCVRCPCNTIINKNKFKKHKKYCKVYIGTCDDRKKNELDNINFLSHN